ncbi:MAG: AmmeMemoRadiSam system protein B [Syntrophorhabdaceae bacterium]|nr:AmmeMemoRadiSam system protein B [Syntrophorhabdaceae bacterium]
MEKPKVRYIEVHPIIQEGKEMVILVDREGIGEHSLVVSKDALFLISLMDGKRSLRDIQVDYMREFGHLLYMEQIEQLVDMMDKNYFLFSENYERRKAELKKRYEEEGIRRPYLAGKSYPENRMELIVYLDEMFCKGEKTNGEGLDGEAEGEIAGLLAPHIDYNRGIDTYRKVYRYLHNHRKPLVVILGTCHNHMEKILSISTKDFSTPLDVVPSSSTISRLVREDVILKEYIDEWPHRIEHSIELQLPLLQFMIQDDFEILPILTGSMHEYIEGEKDIEKDDEIRSILEALKGVLSAYGEPYLIVSGADLAHIGAQFGDRGSLDSFTLLGSKRKDEELLRFISQVDGDGFFRAVKEEMDKRRICGLAPIYFQLKLLEGCTGRIVDYRQWTDGTSSVSFAGGVFYKKKGS